MKIIYKIINETIQFISIFSINFLWLYFYLKKAVLSIILSMILSSIITGIIYLIFAKKNKKTYIKEKQKKLAINYAYQLLFNKKSNVVNFFYQNLKKIFTCTKLTSHIVINNNCNEIILYPYFETEKLTENHIYKILEKIIETNKNYAIIICKEVNTNVMELLKKFNSIKIVVYNQFQTYKYIYEKYNFYPKNILNFDEINKPKFSDIIKLALSKDKFKGYFFSGIVLLLFSFFTPYNIYYVIFSSISFLLCIFCKTNSKFNTTNNQSNLIV